MSKFSKPIRKTDEGVKILLSEVFDDTNVSFTDIDSYYLINGKYYFIEFVKCVDIRPTAYSTLSNLNDINAGLATVIEFVKKAEGILFIVFFEESKLQFLILKTQTGEDGNFQIVKQAQVDELGFKKWFQSLNINALK